MMETVYSHISDNITNPGIRALYRHKGLDITLVSVLAFDPTYGRNAFAATNPNVMGLMSASMLDSLREEIQEYLREEHGVTE